MQYLCKYFCMVMISSQTLWNTIVIAITLNTLNDDFETITVNLFNINNKIINQI